MLLWVHVWAIKNISKKIVGALFGVFLINSPIESILCGFFDISSFFLFPVRTWRKAQMMEGKIKSNSCFVLQVEIMTEDGCELKIQIYQWVHMYCLSENVWMSFYFLFYVLLFFVHDFSTLIILFTFLQ